MARALVAIEDLRRAARRRLPAALFDYIDGAAEGEVTAAANRAAFEELELRPRMAVRVDRRELRTQVVGEEVALPVLLAPCGFVGLLHPDGEAGAARAAAAAGTVFVASTMSFQPIEEIAAAAPGRTWLQLYTVGGRSATEGLLERARRSGVRVLMPTIDTATSGYRERDLRNGVPQLLASGPRAPAHLARFALRPRWVLSHLRARRPLALPNVVLEDGRPLRLADVAPELERSAVVWEDLAWLREAWPGPIVVKGVLTGEDARRAVDAGADAVVVSNHGGRQLDGVPAALRALPEVVEALDGRAEVLLDSGVRRGSDAVKALCLGARAVLVGRAYAYGLAAGGEAGVAHAIELLRSGVERTLALLGCASLEELSPAYLQSPVNPLTGWPARTSTR
jgi:isopentenyl diphosphate isomerase/L-lactate dehydrogenase-like FMN-dependent dehydrogenase